MSDPNGDWILDGLGEPSHPSPAHPEEDLEPEEESELPDDADSSFGAPDAAVLLQQARFWLDLERPKDALRPLQEVVDWYAEDAGAWCEVARAFHMRDDKERALRAAELAIKADPYDAAGYAWKCRVLLHNDDWKDALTAAQAGSDMTYQEAEVERWLVRAWLGGTKREEATQHLAQHEADLDPAETAYLRGELALLGPDLPAADAEFRRALQIAPENSEAWAGLAEVMRKQEKRDEALSCIARAVQLDPGRLELGARTLAIVDAHLGRTARGKARFGTSLMVVSVLCTPGVSTLLLFPLGLVWHLAHRRSDAQKREQVLASLPTELAERYRFAKEKDAQTTRSALGCLLSLALVAVGGGAVLIGLFSRFGWEGALRVIALTLLVVPTVWYSFFNKPAKQTELRFRFPDDPYVPEEDPEEDAAAAPPPEWEPDPLGAGWMFLYEGKPTAACDQARRILAGAPEHADALVLFSAASLLLPKPEPGLAAAKSARSLEFHNERAHALVWAHLVAVGQLEEAVASAEEDRAIADRVSHFLVELIQLQFHFGSADAARALSQFVLRVYPGSSAPHEVEGDWAYEARRWAVAEAAYRRALALDPAAPSLHASLAWTLERRWRFGAACEESRRALALNAQEENARTLLERQATFQAGVMPVLLSLVTGLAATAPTLLGSRTNHWIVGATLCGPPLAAAASFWLQKPVLRRIAPGLLLEMRSSGTMDPWMTSLATGGVALFLHLTLHTLQAWLEIGLHPELLPTRWFGAATVTAWAAASWLGMWKLALEVRRTS